MLYQRATKLVLIAMLAACGGPASEQPQPVGPTVAADPSCPMALAGTSVSEEDTSNGGALVFVTSPASLDGVRKASATLARMHAQRSGPANAMGMMIGTK